MLKIILVGVLFLLIIGLLVGGAIYMSQPSKNSGASGDTPDSPVLAPSASGDTPDSPSPAPSASGDTPDSPSPAPSASGDTPDSPTPAPGAPGASGDSGDTPDSPTPAPGAPGASGDSGDTPDSPAPAPSSRQYVTKDWCGLGSSLVAKKDYGWGKLYNTPYKGIDFYEKKCDETPNCTGFLTRDNSTPYFYYTAASYDQDTNGPGWCKERKLGDPYSSTCCHGFKLHTAE
jgi:hypothetical protein